MVREGVESGWQDPWRLTAGLLVFPWQENHGNRPTLKITEITENHGKSRKGKLKFLLFAIAVPGCHRKSRKITEMEMKVPIVCYCCSRLLSVRVCISLCVFSCDMLMWKYTKVHGLYS